VSLPQLALALNTLADRRQELLQRRQMRYDADVQADLPWVLLSGGRERQEKQRWDE